jgi:hypothetical protein
MYLMTFGVWDLYQMSSEKFDFWPFISPYNSYFSEDQIKAYFLQNSSLYK